MKPALKVKPGAGAFLAILILAVVFSSIAGVVYIAINQNPSTDPKAFYNPRCTYSGPNPAKPGDSASVTYWDFISGGRIQVFEGWGGTEKQYIGSTSEALGTSRTKSFTFGNLAPGNYGVGIRPSNPGPAPYDFFKCSNGENIKIELADTQPPSAPTNLRVVSINTDGSVNLAWNASTDNVGVFAYIPTGRRADVTAPPWYPPSTFGKLPLGEIASVTTTMSIDAMDKAGNRSAKSNSVTFTIPDKDYDGDGFIFSLERYMTTIEYLRCGRYAWPPDFNDDGKVDGKDSALLVGKFLSTDKRYDFNKDGKVNSGDTLYHSRYLGKTCDS